MEDSPCRLARCVQDAWCSPTDSKGQTFVLMWPDCLHAVCRRWMSQRSRMGCHHRGWNIGRAAAAQRWRQRGPPLRASAWLCFWAAARPSTYCGGAASALRVSTMRCWSAAAAATPIAASDGLRRCAPCCGGHNALPFFLGQILNETQLSCCLIAASRGCIYKIGCTSQALMQKAAAR